MKVTETCSCGASIDVKAWDDQGTYEVVADWRRNHRHQQIDRHTPAKPPTQKGIQRNAH